MKPSSLLLAAALSSQALAIWPFGCSSSTSTSLIPTPTTSLMSSASTAIYNKWHETELERWLSDHNIPYPKAADRRDLEKIVSRNWASVTNSVRAAEQTAGESTKSTFGYIQDCLLGMIGLGEKKIQQAGNRAYGGAQQAKDRAYQSARSVTDAAKENTRYATDAAYENAQNIKDSAYEKAQRAQDAAYEKGQEAKDAANERSQAARDRAYEKGQYAKDAAYEKAREGQDYAKEQATYAHHRAKEEL